MRGFDKPTGETVTFTRGEQSLAITFYPLPMGFQSWLQRAFPIPVKYVKGDPVSAAPGAVAEYNDLLTVLFIAKSAEPGTFGTEYPPRGSAADFYRRRAEAFLAEMQSAHFTDGDLASMWTVVRRLSRDVHPDTKLDAAAGNS